jgi:protocatechuate 3,4-dioxygenase, beta subunit
LLEKSCGVGTEIVLRRIFLRMHVLIATTWRVTAKSQEQTRDEVCVKSYDSAGDTVPNLDPPYVFEGYKSTLKRGPLTPLVKVPGLLASLPAPQFAASYAKPGDADLTTRGKATPLGERTVVHGRVTDENGAPVRNSLVEIWQANASGRYDHPADTHDAPLDPNFHGAGHTLTDDEGNYRFVTIRPGSYPWKNHAFAWRPAHIHFSLFGNVYAQRIITQMYFPGDPMLALDPIFNSIADAKARDRLICTLDLEAGIEQVMTGYRFDIVLGGSNATVTGI